MTDLTFPRSSSGQTKVTTSAGTKARQVTSAIKIPKVLKSLHRKPERAHHKLPKFSSLHSSSNSSSKKHHSTNHSSSSSNHYYHTYSHQLLATTSRNTKVSKPKGRREREKRAEEGGGGGREEREVVAGRREERERVRGRREEEREGVTGGRREERERVRGRREEEREGVTGGRREERESAVEERRKTSREVGTESREESVPLVRREEEEEEEEAQHEVEEEEGERGVMQRRSEAEQATISLLQGYRRGEQCKPRLHSAPFHLPPPISPLVPPFSPLAPSPIPDRDLGDLLSCPVCMEEYTPGVKGERHPFFLSCHHSLCGVCLAKLTKTHHSVRHFSDHGNKEMGEVLCPECRLVTPVPPGGLTQNFYLVSLLETRAARLRSQTSNRLRMWCGTCDSVALEGCSTHALTHLTSVLSSSTSNFSSTAARLSTLLHRRAGEQGETARGMRDAVGVLDTASVSLRRQLVTRLETASLAQATATSLLAEVDQMSIRVGCELRKNSSPEYHKNIFTSKCLSRALSSPGTEREWHRGSRKDIPGGRRHRKSRSDLTDLVVNLNSGGIYPTLADDPYLEPSCLTSASTPSSHSLPSSVALTPSGPLSSRSSASIPPSIPPYSASTASLSSANPPSVSTPPASTSAPLTSPLFSSPPVFPVSSISPKSVSLTSTSTSTPSASSYLSASTTLDALTCREQEAKILLLRKCVEALEEMEAALTEGDEGVKEGGGGGKREESARRGSDTEGGSGEGGSVKEGGGVRADEGRLTKEILMEMFKQTVDALD